MRIEPVSTSDTLADVRATNARALLRQPSSASTASTGKTPSPVAEKTPTEQVQSTPVSPQTAPLPQFPEDEVQVQFDKTMNDNILIYQFLDKQSGDVVMQLPSTQVLSIVHEIQAELKKNLAAPDTGEYSNVGVKQGGQDHGN
ncbi:MAG TPA: hypothetical protein VGG46_15315 [Terriglobales bacterium]|jgi:uncharacterized FlaG/YvyC family protein